MSYSTKDVDWTKYLDRKQPLLLFAAFVRPYGSLLEEATGFRFKHQLHIYSGDSGTFVKSAAELEAALEFFLKLAEEKDSRLIEWRDKGVAFNAEADALIAEGKQGTLKVTKENFWELWRICENVMLYDTVIPFRVMVSINAAVEKNGGVVPENLRHAHELFEPFRAGAKYPDLVAHVWPHFYHLAAEMIGSVEVSLLSFTTPLELKGLIEDGVRIAPETLEQRKKWCAFWENPESGIVGFEYEQGSLVIPGITEDHSSVTEVKGSVAYKGVVQGRVHVLNSATDIKDFNEGDIIVSFNTNPSLMAAITKCGAMVTDEGGIMCHAAIISRELKKPCVIGTKIATKVFRDGDMVEVDANTGIVRKLSV